MNNRTRSAARRRPAHLLLLPALLIAAAPLHAAAPRALEGEVVFTYRSPGAESVALAGSFNNWDASARPMAASEEGVWSATVPLSVGYHEYKFVVDGDRWVPDPDNPATVTNNYGEPNSVLYVTALGEVELRAPRSGADAMTEAAGGEGTVYLALVWHQHQPYYLDASRDQLVGPWVRTHTTKDYYDMTAMLAEHPDVHVTVNLTPVLLHQLEDYYVKRLQPYYDDTNNRIRADEFMAAWAGRTDPWVDLMFTPVADFTDEQRALIAKDEWNCFSISRVIMERWPQYAALAERDPTTFSEDDMRAATCFFWLANFDPAFLRGPVELVTGRTVDLSDLVAEGDGPSWTVKLPFSEETANRIVAEFFKIAEAVIPLHREMRYQPGTGEGQVEITTTPYFHPILPLIADVRAGRSGTDQAPDSLLFAHPGDARHHVLLAREAHMEWFGARPDGMWPAEGSVSPDAASIIAEAGLDWIATGDGVLKKSTPEGMEANTPYRIATEHGDLAVFFRDTHLSDLVGFQYQRWEAQPAAEDLARRIMAWAPAHPDSSALVTVLLDGENAWEWYEKDPDAIRFLHAFYAELERLQDEGRLVTVTPAEYLRGNEARGVPAHPVANLPAVEGLWPGSWIRADFSTWIGEDEENRAWYWLEKVRGDIERIAGPLASADHLASASEEGVTRAWRAMFAAEGSDWFWWYGDDQNTGSGDTRWDRLFRAHLRQVYHELREAGHAVPIPEIPSLMDSTDTAREGGGAMTRGD